MCFKDVGFGVMVVRFSGISLENYLCGRGRREQR